MLWTQDCHSCGQVSTTNAGDLYCSKCGAKLRPPVPYGESAARAVFRITFAPVADEFDSEDAAREAAQHACWAEDRELREFDVARLYSAVPSDQYPYVCVCGEGVAKTEKHRCCHCGKEDSWQERAHTPACSVCNDGQPTDDNGGVAVEVECFTCGHKWNEGG